MKGKWIVVFEFFGMSTCLSVPPPRSCVGAVEYAPVAVISSKLTPKTA